MTTEQANAILEKAKSGFGKALIALSIFDATGLKIASTRDMEDTRITTLLNAITESLKKSLELSDFPNLRSYYMIDLKDNSKVIISQSGEYAIDIVFNDEVKMGMVTSVIWPEILKMFKEAAK